MLSTLVNPGDHVVSVMPTYQQLYSIPEMCGAAVDVLHLEKENGYHVDVEALDALCTPETKVICINNPDNPTGALLDGETLRAIVEVARKNDAWLHCDEVYRHLNQTDEYAESVVDLYDKGVTTSSMSKVWSLAGIRLGWCITKDEQLRRDLLSHRDYNLISCGLFDEAVGAYALAHADAGRIWLRFWNGWNRSRTCPSFRPRPARRRSSTTTTTSPPTISAPIW